MGVTVHVRSPLTLGLTGQAASHVPLAPYRDDIFSTVWTRKPLPATVPARNAILFQHATQPLANSVNWKNSLCAQMGLDGNTSASSPTANYVTGHGDGQLSLRREGEYIYVVPEDQPLRPILDQDTTTPTATARFNALVTRLGGLPVPLDARPHTTPDRYIGVYQPSTDRLFNLYAFGTTDPATTTLAKTGSLTSGSTHLTINYGDNAALRQDYFTQTPITYHATAVQVKAAVDNARNATGVVFGTGNGAGIRCQAAGGPLNSSPITLTFVFCDPLTSAEITVTNSTLGPGGVTVDHHPSGPYDRCRRGAIISPSDDGSIPVGVSGFSGTYVDKQDAGNAWWMDNEWNATAAHIEQMGLVPSWEEAQAANDAGTGLGHVLPMVVGHCQYTPIPFVYPATHGDGDRYSSPAQIAEGAVVTFPPDVDLSYVQANCPEFLFIARTIRDNGAVILDKTGFGCEILLRRGQWLGDPFNPWLDVLPRYATMGSSAAHFYMRSLPWHKAQIINPDWWRT